MGPESVQGFRQKRCKPPSAPGAWPKAGERPAEQEAHNASTQGLCHWPSPVKQVAEYPLVRNESRHATFCFNISQMLNTSAFNPPSHSKGGRFSTLHSRRGVKMALAAVLALGSIGLTAGEANALVVNVGGQDYEVTAFAGSYTDHKAKFANPPAPGVMPWWGNQSLANTFATAVGTGLGTNFIGVGPLFAWTFRPGPSPICPVDLIGVPGPGVCSYSWDTRLAVPGVAAEYLSPNDAEFSYAQVDLVPSFALGVPGPLPLFGTAAAFGTSRQLRKRIKAGKGVRSRSTSM